MSSYVNKYAAKPVLALPPPPSRFTYDQWYRHTYDRFRHAEDQNLLADRILEDSSRMMDVVKEKLDRNKETTEMRMKEKITDIEFAKDEIENSRTILQVELEAMTAFTDRIQDALQSLRNSGKRITEKCCVLREGRIGIDLVQDDVEVELRKEIKTIDGAEMILQRTMEQIKEMTREIRSTLYLLTRDLEDKMRVLSIERDSLNMKTTSLDLSIYHGTTPLDASDIAFHEWQHYTEEVILNGFRKVNNARNFRNVVDRILKEVVDDLRNQSAAVNEAFQRRIEEQKEFKTKMEKQLFEVNRQINEMTRNITELEKAIAEKEGYLALAHTRLGRRAHRPQVELVRDEVETRLVNEVVEIRELVGTLQHMLCEAQANLRYLCKTQIQLQEDINIKMNSLKIDEVDCMTMREQRRGIDLSHDEVEKELEAEKKKLIGAEDILKKSLDQTEETMRMLRAGLYMVNKDIEDKIRVLSIDCDCLNTKETSLNLTKYKGGVPLDAANISLQEWAKYKNEIMMSCWAKIHCARDFQTHVNALLKEIVDDLRKQSDAVNIAFQRRIIEVKEAKARLQILHYEITRQINDMNQNVSELETTIREKEAFLALAHTRLEKRANRRGTELVKDEVEVTLVKEVLEINELLGRLQKMSAEANASLRSLLKAQLQLEEQINIKTHSLKIDEVDCMSERQGLEYHEI